MPKKRTESTENMESVNEVTQEVTPSVAQPTDQMIPISDVKRLIAEALQQQSDEKKKPLSLKRTTEHFAHLWRFDGKWVVDFQDQNKDPYVKNKIHAFQRFNQETRQFDTVIELVFQDGTTQVVSLKTYLQRRMPIYCLIKERRKVDKSYSLGQIEKKSWENDMQKGTGKMVEQIVEMYEEVFVLETPEKELFTVNDYVIA